MGVAIKISPENLLKWGGFEDWVDGISSAPTEFILSGASAAVARESTIIKEGTYSCKLTRSGADVSLYHDLPEFNDYQGRKLTLAAWVYCDTADRARISLSDDVGTSASSYHSGVAGWERLTVTRNIDIDAVRIRIEMQITDGNVSAYFDAALLVEGPSDLTILSDIVDISKWSPTNKYKAQTETVTRRDGVQVPNIVLEKISLNIEGMVVGSTSAIMRNNLDSLNSAVNSNYTKPNGDKAVKDLYLYDDRILKGYIENAGLDNKASMRIGDFKLRFGSVQAFYQYYQWLRKSETMSTDPTTFTVTVNGNAYSRPIIKIINNTGGDVTSIIVTNLTSAQSWAYSGTLSTYTTLEVDTDSLSVENDDVDDLTNFSGDTSMILLPGENEIKVEGVSAGIAIVDWVDRWY